MSWRANPGELNKFAVGIILLKEEDDKLGEKTQHVVLESDQSVTHYAFYFALIVIALMIIALIVKLMWNFNGEEGGRVSRTNETTRLLVSDRRVLGVTLYGTNEEDLESGSEDWYDGKTCVICYDGTRNCFFIPCGHCVSCINCAHRIAKEEVKSCPICRGMIDTIRKLRVL